MEIFKINFYLKENKNLNYLKYMKFFFLLSLIAGTINTLVSKVSIKNFRFFILTLIFSIIIFFLIIIAKSVIETLLFYGITKISDGSGNYRNILIIVARSQRSLIILSIILLILTVVYPNFNNFKIAIYLRYIFQFFYLLDIYFSLSNYSKFKKKILVLILFAIMYSMNFLIK
ncbi:hypothetical protein OSC52_02580 [Clostridium pasteurianum]|uniref:hypothetical protein n=1 Tax=Clostridium pasteurianum TaxID=1501 RepID=UPI002260A13F|nr:hypothetical protein [Clostridium pasteurianum]UZW14751.1 hypothetical protein OSC52_02580 [Clostridium pasteurianum]